MRLCFKIKLGLFLLGLLAAPAYAGDMLDILVKDQQEIITLTVKKPVPHKVFTVQAPERLVVDVPVIGGKPSLALPSDYDGKLLKGARYGQFDAQTSRFVFDLSGPIKVDAIDVDGNELTLTIAAQEEKSPPPKAVKKAAEPRQKAPLQKNTGRAEKKPLPKKEEKPLIVIDPGHGGVDPGASGDSGTYEKDIVLAYAKTLRDKLLATGRYRVMLTREDDRFIVLRQRVVIARKAGASMFISLHADSASVDYASGLSIYTVSEQASDKEAESLAARENKADVLSGVDLSEEREDVAGILISLAERETKNRSSTLADILVMRLQDKVDLLPNAHRFAGFAVLKAPDVPSVLIEIGFLSNASEEKLLKSKSYRDKVTSGIAAGVDAYFKLQRTP